MGGKIRTGEEGEVGVDDGLEEDTREVSEWFCREGVKSCLSNVGREDRNSKRDIMRVGVVSCCCFWWWVYFIWLDGMLIVVVLTYVGDRRFTDDGRGCC